MIPVSREAELWASVGERKLKKIDIYVCRKRGSQWASALKTMGPNMKIEVL